MTDAHLLALVWPDLRLSDADTTSFEPMLDALDDLSPRIEAVDTGVALVDITGLGALFGTERRIAARAVALTRAVAPLRVRAGVGENRWLAALAARLARPSSAAAPAAFRALDRDELGNLPLSLLPADPATRQRFGLFGLTTFGQLAALPRSAVGSQFGAVGERLQQLARGNDPRPLVPRRRPERLTATRDFEPPLSDVGAAGLALRTLATELVDRLRSRHLAPGRASLELSREDAPPLHIELAFPQPALEPDWIARLLLSRLEAAARRRPSDRFPPDTNTSSAKRDQTDAPSAIPRANMRKAMPQDATNRQAAPPVSLTTNHSGKWRKQSGADRATLPNSNQDRLRHPDRSNPRPIPAQNLRRSKPSDTYEADPRTLTPPKPAVVEIWQAGDGDEDTEPRVTGIGLQFDRLSNPQSRQLAAFEPQSGRWEELRWALERVQARFGDGRLWRAEHVRPNAALAEQRARLRDIGL
jgi:nucleotidyltransferase/DNA polymerase involved in DNA repair